MFRTAMLCQLLRVLALAALLAGDLPVPAQDAPYTLHIQHNEVVADLFAVDHNTSRPDATLTINDVSVFVENKERKVISFTHGEEGALRPLALWLIAQCNAIGWQSSGSQFVQHHAATLRTGLGHLLPDDSISAATWCDDGQQEVEAPSKDATAAIAKLEQWTAPVKLAKGVSKQAGERSLQAMLRNISTEVAAMQPRPLPVLVFLHQDDTGADAQQYNRVLSTLLEESAIAFVVTDGKGTYHPSPDYLAAGNVAYVLQNIAVDTGGSTMVATSFDEHPDVLGDIVASIIDRLHSRYQISFVPHETDGKVHRLSVRLTDSGRQQHRGTVLQSRKSYLAPSHL